MRNCNESRQGGAHWRRNYGLWCGLVCLALVAWSSSKTNAAVIDVLRYDLGEPGSFIGQLPQDSVGTRHQTNSIGTLSFGGVTDTAAPGSTNATEYRPAGANTGSYGASSAGIPNDNFGIEIWARSHNINQTVNDLFVLQGAANGSVSFRAGNGVWAAHIFNIDWVGAVSGVGQTAFENEWTNLAIIRENGESTFYIDGIAQAGTTFGAPSFGAASGGIHLGVTPGGATYFDGDLDSARIFTFDPNVDDPVAALSINATVPEPHSIAMWIVLGLGAIGFVWRKRRRRSLS